MIICTKQTTLKVLEFFIETKDCASSTSFNAAVDEILPPEKASALQILWIFPSCTASINGGAIYNNGMCQLIKSTFSACKAQGSGGAVFNNDGGSCEAKACEFRNCKVRPFVLGNFSKCKQSNRSPDCMSVKFLDLIDSKTSFVFISFQLQ